ncbi:MAG: amino acid adenylation domain-containing protein, partial [Acidobacteria bacterium]|nr:amino acid adenylation domain-containing protein [Acidobacteriota bacterium]
MKPFDRKNIEDILPLTPMQEGMLFYNLKFPGGSHYFEQLTLDISGTIDFQVFKKAWDLVIETNQMLRTLFRWEGVENPMQVVLKKHEFEPVYYDLSCANDDQVKKTAAEIIADDRKIKFSLQEVPFRVMLCKIEKDKYKMIISNHHILYDGWSNGIILKEFIGYYNDIFEGKLIEIPVKTRFKEYLKWLEVKNKIGQKEFWQDYLAGLETQSPFIIKKRSNNEIARVENFRESFHGQLKTGIEKLVMELKITPASLLYSAWGILLQHYNSSNDVIFGTVVSGRSANVKGIEEVVGLFINTLPLRIQENPGRKIKDLLLDVNETLQTRDKYADTSLTDIKKYGEINNREDIFDTIMVIENYPLHVQISPGDRNSRLPLSIDSYSIFEMAHYDLTVEVTTFGVWEINFSYNKDAFEMDSIGRLAEHFKRIVETILENVNQSEDDVDLLPGKEKLMLLYDFNGAENQDFKNKTIHYLFEEQAAKTPDSVAAVGLSTLMKKKSMALSYAAVNEKSGQLAGVLRMKGVVPGTIVGIMAQRSPELILGIFAILKAGGAFLPIDSALPLKRIIYMINDCHVKYLLHDREIIADREILKDMDVENFISLDECFMPPVMPPGNKNNADKAAVVTCFDKAYLIYTSGTTGRPKGVLNKHGSAANMLLYRKAVYELGTHDIALQFFSHGFDGFVTSFFTPVISGGRVILLDDLEVKDINRITWSIINYRVTHFICVPVLYREIIENLTREEAVSLEVVTLAADHVTPALLEKSHQVLPGIEIVNEYGITESAVMSTIYRHQEEDGEIKIGKPTANTFIYILGKANKLQPIGVPGELCIAGEGVAMGYINNPELTVKKFQPNPIRKGETFYKTGDLARWLPDGNIQLLGRSDFQVKLRGFRIELGEIENQLMTHRCVKEAVVLIKEDRHHSGEQYLCAYIVPAAELDILDLKTYLAQKLPAYMIPAYFVQLGRLPLTRTGKVDRAALPDPERDRSLIKETLVEPRNDIEKLVADAWKHVLKIEKVGVNDNFFDLGGNSSYIIRLTARLKQIFKKEIPVVELFNYPTVSTQARYLAGEKPAGQEKVISPVPAAINTEIAVIGMAGRFPGARDIHESWNNIKEGVESITFFTDEELEIMGVEPGLIKNPNYVKAKGILENVEYFDPFFFDYSTREAELMDPQLRIMHECVYEALEDAGYNPGTYPGSIGLYAGSFSNALWMQQLAEEITSHSGLLAVESLNNRDYLSTRTAYKLNLKGPAITIQTACSTSLVAIDAACQSLISGKCGIAAAGGVTITFQDRAGYLHEEGMVRSPDGHCRPFDANAKGTIGGNGAGIVVLKRLADAIVDGDNIRAIIKGSATNNDGSRKVGYTAPSIEGQAEVIRAAHAAAAIDPETVTYLETHGTGTALGDPVEIEALKQAFGTTKKNYCRLGTLKANIGHLDAAAGVAGFIKTVLALEHRQLPPAVNFNTPNPQIDFENSPFYITNKPDCWENDKYPLRAGVSSFGIGGTNAHVVLEEAPQREPSSPGKNQKLIVLSAKTKNALERMTFNFAQYLKENPGMNLADAAYTLQVGRKAFNHRRMVVGTTSPDIIKALTHLAGNPAVSTAVCEGSSKHVVFMFSGQGSQYVTMGLDLYRTEPVFREEMDRCFEILRPLTQYDFKAILYPSLESDTDNRSDGVYRNDITIEQTEIAQVLLFACEYALAKLVMSWGIKPHAMIGHSIGEYTAACLAGVFTLEDALTLVVWRGKLMQEMAAGAMLSVPLPREELEPLLKSYPTLSLAAVNSTSLCVISGPGEAVEAFAAELKEKGCPATRLHTSHAFHSHMMEPMLERFAAKVKMITLKPPLIPYISNAAGCWITVEQALNPQYWVDHVRGTVYFNEGLTELLKDPEAVMVEVGPGRALSTFARKHKSRGDKQPVINLMRHPGDNTEKTADDYFLLQQVGQLWLAGVDVRWQGFYREEKRRRVPLPTYSFDRRYCWKYGQKIHYKYAAPGTVETPTSAIPAVPGKITGKTNARKDIDQWFYLPQWKAAPVVPAANPGGGSVGKWLVFTDESDFGKSLVNRLQQGGAEISQVKAGSSFARLADGLYTLNPGRPGDYIDLLKSLAIENKIPQDILHLWNTQAKDIHYTNVEHCLEKGFYSLIYLAQAVGKQGITGEMTVTVISGQMQAVTADETGNPLQATLLGACHVISKEYPNIFVRSIDVGLPKPGGREEQKLLDLLLREWDINKEKKEKGESIEPIVAYRNNIRWLPSFNPVDLNSPQDISQRLRKKGVYLITGGMGGIGMVLAEYLAQKVQARLILVDRAPFPEPAQWDQWLKEHSREDSIAIKIRRLKEMEATGAEVMVVQADAADYGRVKNLISEIARRFGTINGLIHAAGLPDGGVIQAKTREIMDAVMAPKIKGTLILDELLAEFTAGQQPLDFIIFFSSLSAILGAFGQAAYTAANVFLDSFARYKNSRQAAQRLHSPHGPHTLTVSINWDAWEEVGMAARAEAEFQGIKLNHPLFRDRVVKADGKIVYNSLFSAKTMWLLNEHRVMDKAVLPGTAYLEMARAAFELHTGSTQLIIKEIFFLEPLAVDDNEERDVRTVLEVQAEEIIFSISNRAAGSKDKWRINATGKMAPLEQSAAAEVPNDPDIDGLLPGDEDADADLADNENQGLMSFGPRFPRPKEIKYGKNRGSAVLELDGAFLDDLALYKLHPALLDRALSILDAGIKSPVADNGRNEDNNYIPFSFKNVKISR